MSVRPMFRKIAIAVFVMLIPIFTHYVWEYIELRRLVAEIEAIRAKGEPVTEYQAGRGRSPEGEEQLPGRLYIASAVMSGEVSEDWYPPIAAMHEWLAGGRSAPPSPGDALNAILARSADSLEMADRAGALAFKGFPPGMSYSYRTAELFNLSRLMSARTVALSSAGNGDSAVDSALSLAALRQALGEGPRTFMTVGELEVPAILSLSNPSPEALRRLSQVLERDERPDQGVDDMLAERARVLESTWQRLYGGSPDATRSYRFSMRTITETVLRPWITHRMVGLLQRWAELVAAARIPWPQRSDAIAAMTAKYGGERFDPRNTWLPWIPSVWPPTIVYESFARFTAPHALILNRASRAAVAVELYRRANKGALPGALADLVPAYLIAVPQDPCNGDPLRFRRDAASYTIYSVGPDRKDDGGDLNSELLKAIKQGYGRRIVRGADLGVRVVIR